MLASFFCISVKLYTSDKNLLISLPWNYLSLLKVPQKKQRQYFDGQNLSAEKIFGSKTDFLDFHSPRFCPIRYFDKLKGFQYFKSFIKGRLSVAERLCVSLCVCESVSECVLLWVCVSPCLVTVFVDSCMYQLLSVYISEYLCLAAKTQNHRVKFLNYRMTESTYFTD